MRPQQQLTRHGRSAGPFSLDAGAGPVLSRFSRPVESLLGLDALNALYYRVRTGPAEEFFDRVLDDLDIQPQVEPRDMDNVPKTGPVVIVSNHPLGAVDGVVLASVLRKARPDLRVMANHLLARIPELRPWFILVDPFGTAGAEGRNRRPLLEAFRRVSGGGALLVFPAGEVGHFQLGRGAVVEGPWHPSIARLIRRTNAAVVPAFIGGTNSAAFHAAGLIHPRLRTAMLPREVLRRAGRTVQVRFGSAIPARRCATVCDTDADLAGHLRNRSLILAGRAEKRANPAVRSLPSMQPIIDPVAPERLESDIASLPAEQKLATAGGQSVYIAYASQVPSVVRELGRLREITYRASGEGTGRSIDLDEFDQTYLHLFIHDPATRSLVGAYRLGPADKLIERSGAGGLYTNTLFRYSPDLLRRMNPALELGRAFVRAEYQRSYAPLMLLWKGIAAYVAAHPWYNRLFGPVSISNDYGTSSRELLVRFLQSGSMAEELKGMARPRNAFRFKGRGEELLRRALDEQEVESLLTDLEPDGKGVPVLLRQYMKLGARFISFNVDRAFGDAVDALMVVDLTKTDRRILDRYMGRDVAERFLAYHARPQGRATAGAR